MQIASTNRVVVEPSGADVVAHVGLHALGAFADRLGLSHLLSSRIVEERAAQDVALGTVPRAGPDRAPQPPTRRARDRWLARDQGADRLLRTRGPHHLTQSSPTRPTVTLTGTNASLGRRTIVQNAK